MIETRIVVNAAGVYADEINNQLSDRKLHITARKGEYMLLDKTVGDYVKSTIFQLPSKMGKGVLVTPTVHGNLLVGPTAVNIEDKEAVNTTMDGLNQIAKVSSRSVKDVPFRQVITSFAGLRAHEDGDDFIIGEASDVQGLINAAGIESPGLSSAPAIGVAVAELVRDILNAEEKLDFNPIRHGILDLDTLSLEERNQLIKENPAYGNIIVTIITTLFAVAQIYEGKFWNKCIFTIAFNAIWMLIETISGNILLTYCCEFTDLQALGTLGSFTSKIVFMIAITALKRVFTKDEIKELPVRYSFMLVLIPIGSIYIMNNIFMLGYKLHSNRANIQSAVTAVILLGVNVLVFYIYIKLADDLQLRRMTSVYEQQLDLCERHQQERELSILRLRDMRHNMKNNLVSILAYAENGDNEKIIRFVNEIMEEGGIKTSTVTNSGNIVIDSLIGYWYVEAKKVGIDFSVNLNIPMEMPFRGADICLILGNLLEML